MQVLEDSRLESRVFSREIDMAGNPELTLSVITSRIIRTVDFWVVFCRIIAKRHGVTSKTRTKVRKLDACERMTVDSDNVGKICE